MEARWNVYRRRSLVGFLGGGSAFGKFAEEEFVPAGGVDFRYEIARPGHPRRGGRRLPDEEVLYLTVGRAG